jgi:hypothetical protein
MSTAIMITTTIMTTIITIMITTTDGSRSERIPGRPSGRPFSFGRFTVYPKR